MSKKKDPQEGYFLGTVPGTDQGTRISDEDMVKHILVVGGERKGKTSFLKHLVHVQLTKGRSFAVFDSKGDLYEYALHALASGHDQRVVLADSLEKQWIVGFNPLKRGLLPESEHRKRLIATLIEAALREGLDLRLYEQTDPLQGAIELFKRLSEGRYFDLSLRCPEPTLDFPLLFQENRKLLVRVVQEPGSFMYGMLLYNDFLIAAEHTRVVEPYLVLVDDAFSFVTAQTIDAFPVLRSNDFALVVVSSYKQLRALREQPVSPYPGLLQYSGSVMSLGYDEDDPEDIVREVVGWMLDERQLH